MVASAYTNQNSSGGHRRRLLQVSAWLAAAGCVTLLLSISVSKAGQNIGGGLILLAFLAAGTQAWRDALRQRLVWATLAWIAAVTVSMFYAAAVIGVPLDEQTTQLWRFSRLFLIPLMGWGIAISGLSAYHAYLILFTGFVMGTTYHMATTGWPWFFTHPGRLDISGENEQFYGLLSATALTAAVVFASQLHRWITSKSTRIIHYILWSLVALAAIQGLFISMARGAFLAMMVAGMGWSFMAATRAVSRGRMRWRHAAAVGFIALSAAATVYYGGIMDPAMSRFQADVEALAEGPDDRSGFFRDSAAGHDIPMAVRLNQWRVGLGALMDHGLLGHGTDGSRLVRDQAELPEHSARAAPHHFHNIYIDVLVRFGLVGLVAMGWFALEYGRAVRQSHPQPVPPIAQFAMLASVLFLVAGLTQTYWTSQVTWFFLAAVLGPATAGLFKNAHTRIR